MLPVAILAGGLATRLRPATEHTPKALLPVCGEPFLAHQLRLLSSSGIDRVVLCVGYRGEQIQEYAGDGSRFSLHLDYSFDGPRLLGTAGALRQALPLLGESFFVLYGDSYLPCDYAAIERAFVGSRRPALMTVFRNEGQWDASNVQFAEGRIVKYDKVARTAQMRHIDYGLGVFRRAAFEAVPVDVPADLAAVYQALLQKSELAGWEAPQRFYEVGSFAGIRELEQFLESDKHLRQRPLALPKAPRRAVFLDRDGVLNEAVVRGGQPYPPATVAELKLFPDAAAALDRLERAGFLLIVVSNQPDVARGAQSRETVDAINAAIAAQLPVLDFLVCWHDDADGCGCRKPKPGLLLEAATKYGIDLGGSFLVGDRWRDIDAGAAAGCRTVLIDRHYIERPPQHPPHARAVSLSEAVQWILAGAASSRA
jgi:histidinol-phosphate phosphatase family protein